MSLKRRRRKKRRMTGYIWKRGVIQRPSPFIDSHVVYLLCFSSRTCGPTLFLLHYIWACGAGKNVSSLINTFCKVLPSSQAEDVSNHCYINKVYQSVFIEEIVNTGSISCPVRSPPLVEDCAVKHVSHRWICVNCSGVSVPRLVRCSVSLNVSILASCFTFRAAQLV